ncbi:MAG: CoA transferase [Pseudomonadales bacterium]
MSGPLSNVRIIDLTDEKSIYGVKLLADLGADVVRPEPPTGDPLRDRGPFKGNQSLWHIFFGSSRRFVSIDLPTEQSLFHNLLTKADLIITGPEGFGVSETDFDVLQADNPELIVVDVRSFGREGPWKDYLAPDLVAGALGGAVATTGDADTPPLKNYGELNFMVSGAYAAIAGLAGLYARREKGAGQVVDVSVHESIASCLEHVLMFYWYHDRMMREPVLPRRGSLHWSNAYVVFQAKDGGVMVTPTPDFDRQLAWLIEEGVQEDLIDPKYDLPEHLVERIMKTMDILKRWVATKEAEPLFLEAQQRHSPYGWVIPLAQMADNEQLRAREWFADTVTGAEPVKGPGAPYHFSETPWGLGVYGDTHPLSEVMEDIGWEVRS